MGGRSERARKPTAKVSQTVSSAKPTAEGSTSSAISPKKAAADAVRKAARSLKEPLSIAEMSKINAPGAKVNGPNAKVSAPKPKPRSKDKKEASDPTLVADVKAYMKLHKLSQVTVGQEARISQAVISQWLSLKYHGHNDKVDAAMRVWLSQRKAGLEVVPNPDDPTSVLRPSRAVTVAEKMEAKKRKSMSKASGERERKHNKELTALQETAAAEGQALKKTMLAAKSKQPQSLQSTMFGDSQRQLGDQRMTPARSMGKASGPNAGGPLARSKLMLSPGYFAPPAVAGLHETPIGDEDFSGPLHKSSPIPPFWENDLRKSPAMRTHPWQSSPFSSAGVGAAHHIMSPGPGMGLESAPNVSPLIHQSMDLGSSSLSLVRSGITESPAVGAMAAAAPELGRSPQPASPAPQASRKRTAAPGSVTRSPLGLSGGRLSERRIQAGSSPSGTVLSQPMQDAMSYVGESPDEPENRKKQRAVRLWKDDFSPLRKSHTDAAMADYQISGSY